MPVSQKLVDILACPDCRGDIVYKKATAKKPEHLICKKCKRKFEIDDGVPIMMPKGQD